MGFYKGTNKEGHMGGNIGSVPRTLATQHQIVGVIYSESSPALELPSKLLFLEEAEEFQLLGQKRHVAVHTHTTLILNAPPTQSTIRLLPYIHMGWSVLLGQTVRSMLSWTLVVLLGNCLPLGLHRQLATHHEAHMGGIRLGEGRRWQGG